MRYRIENDLLKLNCLYLDVYGQWCVIASYVNPTCSKGYIDYNHYIVYILYSIPYIKK